MEQVQKKDKKLGQFIEELNELQERYQYNIKAVLNVTDMGILPAITVKNRIPPKKETKPIKPVKSKK